MLEATLPRQQPLNLPYLSGRNAPPKASLPYPIDPPPSQKSLASLSQKPPSDVNHNALRSFQRTSSPAQPKSVNPSNPQTSPTWLSNALRGRQISQQNTIPNPPTNSQTAKKPNFTPTAAQAKQNQDFILKLAQRTKPAEPPQPSTKINPKEPIPAQKQQSLALLNKIEKAAEKAKQDRAAETPAPSQATASPTKMEQLGASGVFNGSAAAGNAVVEFFINEKNLDLKDRIITVTEKAAINTATGVLQDSAIEGSKEAVLYLFPELLDKIPDNIKDNAPGVGTLLQVYQVGSAFHQGKNTTESLQNAAIEGAKIGTNITCYKVAAIGVPILLAPVTSSVLLVGGATILVGAVAGKTINYFVWDRKTGEAIPLDTAKTKPEEEPFPILLDEIPNNPEIIKNLQQQIFNQLYESGVFSTSVALGDAVGGVIIDPTELSDLRKLAAGILKTILVSTYKNAFQTLGLEYAKKAALHLSPNLINRIPPIFIDYTPSLSTCLNIQQVASAFFKGKTWFQSFENTKTELAKTALNIECHRIAAMGVPIILAPFTTSAALIGAATIITGTASNKVLSHLLWPPSEDDLLLDIDQSLIALHALGGI